MTSGLWMAVRVMVRVRVGVRSIFRETSTVGDSDTGASDFGVRVRGRVRVRVTVTVTVG